MDILGEAKNSLETMKRMPSEKHNISECRKKLYVLFHEDRRKRISDIAEP